MKYLISRFTNTVKAIQLLSDPYIVESLYSDMKLRQKESAKKDTASTSKLGTKDAFYHKHFIVQIVN